MSWTCLRVKLDDVMFVSSLVRLRTLDLSNCSLQLVDGLPLSSLTSLNALYLDYACLNCHLHGHLVDVSPVSSLVALQTLQLVGCGRLTDVSPLSFLTSLTSLDLSKSSQLVNVVPLSSLTSLISLRMCCCNRLGNVSPTIITHLLDQCGPVTE